MYNCIQHINIVQINTEFPKIRQIRTDQTMMIFILMNQSRNSIRKHMQMQVKLLMDLWVIMGADFNRNIPYFQLE